LFSFLAILRAHCTSVDNPFARRLPGWLQGFRYTDHTEGDIFSYGYRGFPRIVFPGMFAQEETELTEPATLSLLPQKIREIRGNP